MYYSDVTVCLEDLHFANDFPDGSIIYLLHGGGNRYLLGEEKELEEAMFFAWVHKSPGGHIQIKSSQIT